MLENFVFGAKITGLPMRELKIAEEVRKNGG